MGAMSRGRSQGGLENSTMRSTRPACRHLVPLYLKTFRDRPALSAYPLAVGNSIYCGQRRRSRQLSPWTYRTKDMVGMAITHRQLRLIRHGRPLCAPAEPAARLSLRPGPPYCPPIGDPTPPQGGARRALSHLRSGIATTSARPISSSRPTPPACGAGDAGEDAAPSRSRTGGGTAAEMCFFPISAQC